MYAKHMEDPVTISCVVEREFSDQISGVCEDFHPFKPAKALLVKTALEVFLDIPKAVQLRLLKEQEGVYIEKPSEFCSKPSNFLNSS